MAYIAGILMAAGAAFCIYAGLWPFAGLVALIGVLMAYEHATIVFGPDSRFQLALEAAALAASPLLMAAGQPFWALGLVTLAALVTAFRAKTSGTSKRWGGGAVIYIGVALMAVVWLRDQPQGFVITLWLFVSIWATDSLAQIVGKRVGGPKLAPVTSPNKTWSGLLGGIAGAVAVGVLTGAVLQADGMDIVLLGVLGVFLAVCGQLGDLLESAFKRHFDVKDSSNLIPGHGGVLDRVDGLAMAAIFAAVLMLLLGSGPFATIPVG